MHSPVSWNVYSRFLSEILSSAPDRCQRFSVVVDLSSFLYLFTIDSNIYFLSIEFIIATYAIFNFRPIFNLNRKLLFFYLNDVAASFLIPLIFFVAFKVSSDLDVDDYLIVKITSLFSAAIGSLILVDFKKMDKLNSAGKKINFF